MAVWTALLGSKSIVLQLNYGASGPLREVTLGRGPSVARQLWSVLLHEHNSGLVLSPLLCQRDIFHKLFSVGDR